MPSMILGIGTALPANTVSQSDTLQLAKSICCTTSRQERFLEELYSKSGVNSRATVLQTITKDYPETNFFPPPTTTYDTGPTTAARMTEYEKKAAPLAGSACREALNQSGLTAAEITHLVTVSCTGFAAPGFDLSLLKTLPLDRAVKRTHVGFMGCHGALNGLRVANGYCAENPNNVVLVCATELCSMHFQYGWSRERLISNALFADGAAAAVISNKNYSNKESALRAIQYDDSASYVVPDAEDAMTWTIGNSGFVMTLANNVPDLIEENLPSFLDRWLVSNKLTREAIKGWAVHPGGPRILDAVSHSLNLPDDALAVSRQILAECGNMSSPTVLFILQRLLTRGDALPCVILGFGPGLTVEAALVR